MGEKSTQLDLQYHKWIISNLVVGQKAPMETAQITQAIVKSIACPLQTNWRTMLLNTTPTEFTMCRKVNLVSTWSLYPFCIVLIVLESTLHTTSGERENTNPFTKPAIYNSNCLQDTLMKL